MLESFQIKKEKPDIRGNAEKCNCDYEEKEKVTRKVRQVLVNFGLSRKKVFTLHGKNEKLYEQFKNHILSEPAFSELLNDSYVVFQQFSEKFGTWVDIDVNEKLKDGTVLNAVFFPNNIERDESNPGCIKRKEVFIVTENVKKKRSSNIIQVDLTEENENSVIKTNHSKGGKFSKVSAEEQNHGEGSEEGNFKKNEKNVRSSLVNAEVKMEGKEEEKTSELKNKEEKVRSSDVNKEEMKNEEDNIKKNEEQLIKKKTKTLPEVIGKKASKLKNTESGDQKKECLKKNRSSVKTNVFLTEEHFQNGDESNPKNQQEIYEPKKHWNQEEGNCSTRKQELNYTWPEQNVPHKMPSGSKHHYPETTDNFQASKKEWQRKNENQSPRNLVVNDNSFVSEIYSMCDKMNWPDPVFVTKGDPVNGFSCELKVNDIIYFNVHSNSSKVEEAVAEVAFNYLTEKESCSNTFNTQYCGSWQRGPRKPSEGNYGRSSRRSPRRPFQRNRMQSQSSERL